MSVLRKIDQKYIDNNNEIGIPPPVKQSRDDRVYVPMSDVAALIY